MKKEEVKCYRTYRFTAIHNLLRRNFDDKKKIERIHVLFTMLLHIYFQVKIRKDKAEDLFNDIPSNYPVRDEEYLNTNDKVFLCKDKVRLLLGRDYVRVLFKLRDLCLVKFEHDNVGKIKFARNIILDDRIINSDKTNVDYYKGHIFNSLHCYYNYWEIELRDNVDCFHHNWKNSIVINATQFDDILDYRYTKLKNKKAKKRKKSSKKRRKRSLEQYKKGQNYLLKVIQQFNRKKNKSERLINYKTDDFSERFHSIFTRIPKEIRHYTRLFDKRCGKFTNDLLELDIKSSQPSFLSQSCINETGVSGFADLLNQDIDIYEQWKDINSHECRDDAKKDMFVNMFQCSYYGLDASDITERMVIFKREFPAEANYIHKLQSRYKYDLVERKRCVARAMQKLEVKAFKEIWDALIALNIPFVSVHDSIIFPNKDRVIVEDIVINILNRHLPSVKYRLHINKLGKNIIKEEIENWKVERDMKFRIHIRKISEAFACPEAA